MRSTQARNYVAPEKSRVEGRGSMRGVRGVWGLYDLNPRGEQSRSFSGPPGGCARESDVVVTVKNVRVSLL